MGIVQQFPGRLTWPTGGWAERGMKMKVGLEVVDGRMVLPNGERQFRGGWRAIAVAPPPLRQFRPVWRADWAPDQFARVSYQSVWPGDAVLFADCGAESIVCFLVKADGSLVEKASCNATDVLETFPSHLAAAVTAWLFSAGDSKDCIPPAGAGWDGEYTLLARERAEKVHKTFTGAPNALVEQLAEETSRASDDYAPDWSNAGALPTSLEVGKLWVIWHWIGAVEIVDLRNSADPVEMPHGVVRAACVWGRPQYTSWRLFNRSVE